MLDVPVIDPHVHFWDPRSTPRRVSPLVKVLGWNPKLLRTLGMKAFPRAAVDFVGKPDFVMDAFLPGDWRSEQRGFDVRGVVHVQAGWEDHAPLGPVGETRWLESLCGRDLLGIVGHANVEDAELATVLDAHQRASERFVGVRDMTAFDPDPGVHDWTPRAGRMRSRAFARGLSLLGERGLSFDAWCYHPQLPELAELAREASGTRIVLCHLGTPIGYGGPYAGYGRDARARERIFAEWKDGLARVAEQKNVHAKISGLAMPILGFGFHTRESPQSAEELADRIGPLALHALSVFGVERCLFASNFPMDKVSVPWSTLYGAFAKLTSGLDQTARRRLFHDNAAAFYRLRPPSVS
jgi:L-fuconolactonase